MWNAGIPVQPKHKSCTIRLIYVEQLQFLVITILDDDSLNKIFPLKKQDTKYLFFFPTNIYSYISRTIRLIYVEQLQFLVIIILDDDSLNKTFPLKKQDAIYIYIERYLLEKRIDI